MKTAVINGVNIDYWYADGQNLTIDEVEYIAEELDDGITRGALFCDGASGGWSVKLVDDILTGL